MTKPATLNLDDAYRGDPYALALPMWDDTVDPPTVLVLTGRSYTAQVRENPDALDAWDFAIDHSHLGDGYIVLSLSGAQTAQMPENCWFDIEETITATLDKQTIIRGTFFVGRDITR